MAAPGRSTGVSGREQGGTVVRDRWLRIGRVGALAVLVSTLINTGPAPLAEQASAQGQQPDQLTICGATGNSAVVDIGKPGPDGWTQEASLDNAGDQRRFKFSVEKTGTAYVYVGDQWYNLDLGIFSNAKQAEACWQVQGKALSQTADRRVMQFVRPDERAIEVEKGDYILTIRTGDAMGFDPSKKFTVRVAVGPRTCALTPANQIVPEYPWMTKKPDDNPDLFQLGASIEPGEADLTQFSLMSFNASVSPPYTDLFDFTWEIDGKVVPNETGPTFLKPYADLAKMPMGLHTLTLKAKGAREYKDPTESRFNFTPFNGETREVKCQFRGPA